jgi:histidinol phosphatase-like PHP family hydrolase
MRSDLFAGRYLFHLHTQLTDGTLSVSDYFEYACSGGIDRLVFLEHIRRQPSYPVLEFATRVAECASSYGLQAVLGFEAKLLSAGTLDISSEHLAMAEVVGIAEHSFPDDPELLRNAFVNAVDFLRSSFPSKPAVWVHPGLWFKKRGLVPDSHPTFLAMVAHAQSRGVFLERNLRYDLVSEAVTEVLLPASLVVGADAHRLADLHNWAVKGVSMKIPSTI